MVLSFTIENVKRIPIKLAVIIQNRICPTLSLDCKGNNLSWQRVDFIFFKELWLIIRNIISVIQKNSTVVSKLQNQKHGSYAIDMHVTFVEC